MEPLFRVSRAVPRDPAIDRWLDRQSPDLAALARRWFARMRACGGDVREVIHDGCPVACVEDAPFAYVNVFRAHANVGFFLGARLDDPSRLLVGTGKRMRHVKLTPGAEIDADALTALIDAAYIDIKARLTSA
jgi:hypothetical protein